MKTYSAHFHREHRFQLSALQVHIPAMVISARDILTLLGALTVASAIVILSIWTAGTDSGNILGAASWGVALVFMALAVDSQAAAAVLKVLTGGALAVLAWLQSSVSPDYVILSGILVAAWIGVAVFRRLQ